MVCYLDNSSCILDYLELFKALSKDEPDVEVCGKRWQTILEKERGTERSVPLAPVILREKFGLSARDFFLVMAALALEMDGRLRGVFRSRYGLALPTVEYGIQLIAPLSPADVETLAELAGFNVLCGLLLTTAEQTAYPMERPLILSRAVLAFLTGLSLADIPGVTPMMDSGEEHWLPLHGEAFARIREWAASGADTPLYLCAPVGSGRRTLLRRTFGGTACIDLVQVGQMSALDRDHVFREAAVTATLLSMPLCVLPSRDAEHLRELERLCRRFTVPLVVLAETDGELAEAKEVVRLPRQLTIQEREAVWRAFVPQYEPEAVPGGAMTVGAVAETAALAVRYAMGAGRDIVEREDTQRAMRHRGGALEFGIRYDVSMSLEDMVLPDSVREQLDLICRAAQSGPELAAWGLSQQYEGVTAVFHGPSGTGKTMAATAIAGRLGMPLLRADLSQIMDKYVGETEKHLAHLLQSARENRCVLLFDEADSLFGKRASVSTGHDKYANLSTSYLLQEIERYEGVALLSTNLLSNFDDAFLRRLHYIIRFSLPDAALRETLWRRALPAERLEGEIPFEALAQAELSPARIYGVVRNAAVAALGGGQKAIDAKGIIRALRLELEKSGKSLPRNLEH